MTTSVFERYSHYFYFVFGCLTMAKFYYRHTVEIHAYFQQATEWIGR